MSISAIGGGYSSILEAIPELASLSSPGSGTSPYLGGRDFTYGCLQAVNESLQIVNGSLALNALNYFEAGCTILQIQDAATYGTLCTANGTAPRVVVPYQWCKINCWGWQASHWSSLQQWIGPLVQFILPCLAFCLSVPRNWKFSFPERLFEVRSNNDFLYFVSTYLIKFPIAFVIVFWDTILWLSICFAVSGPMLLSAVYEYTWDGLILDFLQPRNGDVPQIPPVTKARLLLAVVVGNVNLATSAPMRTPTLPSGIKERISTSPSDIWLQIMEIAEELTPRTQSEQATATDVRRTSSGRRADSNSRLQPNSESSSDSIGAITGVHRSVSRVGPDLKLKALLNAQTRYAKYPTMTLHGNSDLVSSFGGAVGAPVVFFIGSFVYNIVEAETRLGDNDTAHALAFGMWWMTISHLAVVSSAVLASNNPNALQGLIGERRLESPHHKSTTSSQNQANRGAANRTVTTSSWTKFVGWMKTVNVLENAFDSTFEPLSLWKRGPNKRLWIDKALEAYSEDRHDNDHYMEYDALESKFKLGFRRRVIIWLMNLFVLLGAPCALAFATSYTTPVAGLGCRSLTHLVYYATQVVQMLLWSWNVDLSRESPTSRQLHVCRGLQIGSGAVAVLAAIGGTLMQIMGVYRNCLCKVPTGYYLGTFGNLC